MEKNKLQDALQRGIYGTAETLPEERALFLSTIRERIYLALTNKQVLQKGMYVEALQLMKSKKNLRLFINGSLSYTAYSNYVKEATIQNIPFTIVNDNKDSPVGLVLASETARDDSDHSVIFIEDDIFKRDMI